MVESIFEDYFGVSGLGFNLDDLNNREVSEIDPDNIKLDFNGIKEVHNELHAEECSLAFDVYTCG